MAEPANDSTTGQGAEKPLIIVVDDDRSIVEGLAILLDGWGYEVVTALSAAALEQRLESITRPPNLIIADHYLPAGRTGRDVVERLRAVTGQDIPAIILTGDTTPERRDEAQLLGCQLLLKPVQVGPLREAVEALSRP
ncbi:response regulator [Azospirillum sp. TSO35-2]|uniref:response regulator n=1 Tax=Azospirillum sp. TSO35-2 TaxID=716796 RepID=UPI000D604440|nr:response regulator [Azospirillum sp. TSO35-2]PWC31001.1 regulator [Azospirillum sp. TSO35-2]